MTTTRANPHPTYINTFVGIAVAGLERLQPKSVEGVAAVLDASAEMVARVVSGEDQAALRAGRDVRVQFAHAQLGTPVNRAAATLYETTRRGQFDARLLRAYLERDVGSAQLNAALAGIHAAVSAPSTIDFDAHFPRVSSATLAAKQALLAVADADGIVNLKSPARVHYCGKHHDVWKIRVRADSDAVDFIWGWELAKQLNPEDWNEFASAIGPERGLLEAASAGSPDGRVQLATPAFIDLTQIDPELRSHVDTEVMIVSHVVARPPNTLVLSTNTAHLQLPAAPPFDVWKQLGAPKS